MITRGTFPVLRKTLYPKDNLERKTEKLRKVKEVPNPYTLFLVFHKNVTIKKKQSVRMIKPDHSSQLSLDCASIHRVFDTSHYY